MKAVRLISLIARVALIVTLGLGLLYWIAQLFVWIGLLVFLAQIGFPDIHEGFGTIGVLGLLILGTVAVFTNGSRLLGAGSMIYAFLVPAFGEKRSLYSACVISVRGSCCFSRCASASGMSR